MANEINDLADLLDGKTPIEQAPPPVAEQQQAAPETPPVPVTNEQPKPVNEDLTNQDKGTPPANEPPAYNPDEELVKITGGTIKSKAELDGLLQKANALTDLESRVKQYEEENTSLKAKASADPFANEYYKKLNQLAKDGASPDQLNAFSKVNTVGDIDKLDAVEAKVLALQLKEGLTEQEARSYINRTFKTDPEVYTEEEIENAKIDLKISSRADRDFLKSHKTEVETSPTAALERQAQLKQQQYEQHLHKVEPIAKAVITEAKDMFKGISINGKTGEGAIALDFTPSEASLHNLEGSIKAYVEQLGESLPATPAGREQIEGFAKSVLAIANYQNWMVEAASQREKQVRAEYHNPTPINRGPDNPNPAKSSQDELNQRLLEIYS